MCQNSILLCFVVQAIAWANKSTDNSYPDTCLQWAGFLAKLAIHYDRVSDGNADVGIMNRVSCSKIRCAWGLMLHGGGKGGGEVACTTVERNTIQGRIPVGGTLCFDACQVKPAIQWALHCTRLSGVSRLDH